LLRGWRGLIAHFVALLEKSNKATNLFAPRLHIVHLCFVKITTESNTVKAVWLRVPQAVQLTGLSRSKVYELISSKAIRSASLRDPGQRHATRLIDRAALLAFIESHVETK